MARIAGVDLPREKRVEIGLTYVFGIGRKTSNEILAKTGINPDTRVKDLTEEEAAKLREVIERDYNVEGDLRREIGLNIKRLVEIGCYRGLRHRRGLPVRGQRTKTNARTRKGPKKTISPKALRVGDTVKVLTMGINGTVSTLPNQKGDLYVQMGILRSQVNIKDLELVDEATISGPGVPTAPKNKTGSGKIKMSKSLSVSPEINLIGMTTDEAVPAMEKYLDDAYLAHLPQVRVVHGRGTGALRAACHKRLKKLNYVKEFRLGEYGEGDTGVTIVVFK